MFKANLHIKRNIKTICHYFIYFNDIWTNRSVVFVPVVTDREGKLRGSPDFLHRYSHIKRNFDPMCHLVAAINDM